MAKHSLNENFETLGEWFLPVAPTQKLGGTLAWKNHHGRLDLHGSFTQILGDIYGDESNSYPVLHGVTLDSNLITLLDASGVMGRMSFGPGGFRQSERVRSNLLVIGDHVPANAIYVEMQVRIPGLETWLNRGGLSLTFTAPAGKTPAAAHYVIENPPPEDYSIADIEAMVSFAVRRTFGNLTSHNVNVTSYGTVTITPQAPRELGWYFDQLGKVCTLLGFLAGTPMGPDKIEVKQRAGSGSLDVLVSLQQDKYCRFDDANQFFLLRSDLGEDFGSVLLKWFELYSDVETASQLAQSVLFSDDLWLHVEFLSLMQALEGFHRATCSGFYMSPEDYEPIKRELIESIPDGVEKSHRASLKSRIEYGNEISLAKRLSELARRLPEKTRRYLFGLEGAVPRSWIDTRNYYTHWDEKSRAGVLDGVDMYNADTRLRLFLRALYLDLLGVPLTAVESALSGKPNKECQRLISLNNAEIRKAYPEVKVKPLMSIRIADTSESKDSDQATGQ